MDAKLKAIRYSAISQAVLGILFVIFGIADRATIYKKYKHRPVFHTESVVPIWMGALIWMTGVVGYFVSRKNRERPSTALIRIYLGFSIVSILFAGAIISTYSIGIAVILGYGESCVDQRKYLYRYNSYQSLEEECNTSVGLGSLIIIFAIIEFGVGSWASHCCCSQLGTGCCNPEEEQKQMEQVVSIQTDHGPAAYVIPVAQSSAISYIIVPGSFRYSAISQLVLGTLLVILGIIDVIAFIETGHNRKGVFFPMPIIGVTMASGVLIIISGSAGYCAARSGRLSSGQVMPYLACSIVSIVSTVAIITTIIFILSMSDIATMGDSTTKERKKIDDLDIHVRIATMIIVCACIEFGVGIWATVSCCSICNKAQQQQKSTIINVQTTDGLTPHVVTSYTDGFPVVKPAVSLGLPANIFPTFPSELQMGQVIYVKKGYELFVHVVTMGADGFPVAVPDETPDQTQQPAAYPLNHNDDNGSQLQQQQQQYDARLQHRQQQQQQQLQRQQHARLQQQQHGSYQIYYDDYEAQHEATSQLQNDMSLKRQPHARSEEERNHRLSTLV